MDFLIECWSCSRASHLWFCPKSLFLSRVRALISLSLGIVIMPHNDSSQLFARELQHRSCVHRTNFLAPFTAAIVRTCILLLSLTSGLVDDLWDGLSLPEEQRRENMNIPFLIIVLILALHPKAHWTWPHQYTSKYHLLAHILRFDPKFASSQFTCQNLNCLPSTHFF